MTQPPKEIIDDAELREQIEKIISLFGLAAAFHGINKKNPVPKDPTDEIIEVITQHSQVIANEARIDELEHLHPEQLKVNRRRCKKCRQFHRWGRDCNGNRLKALKGGKS